MTSDGWLAKTKGPDNKDTIHVKGESQTRNVTTQHNTSTWTPNFPFVGIPSLGYPPPQIPILVSVGVLPTHPRDIGVDI